MEELRTYRIWYGNKDIRSGKFQKREFDIISAPSGRKAIEIMVKKYPNYRFSKPIWVREI